jgi:hypothetical protein
VPTAQSLAARSVPFGAKGAASPSSASEVSASTARASDVGALAGGDVAAGGSKSSDSKSSGESRSCDSESSKSSFLSAASTQDFHAQLELQLDAEKNDLHLDNLTGLNDMVGAAVSWAAPRRSGAAADPGAQKHGEGPQEEKKARTA